MQLNNVPLVGVGLEGGLNLRLQRWQSTMPFPDSMDGTFRPLTTASAPPGDVFVLGEIRDLTRS